ncbi:MAG: PilN domain-containing protein [Gemmatimonadaceae bacterium]
MIEINLLPGSGKKPRGRSAGINLGQIAADAASRVKDPYLAGAVASVFIAVLAIGGMFWMQRAREHSLNAGLQKAEQDSIRFAGVIREKRKAEAQRDSVLHQVQLIKSFDNKRFIWPHIMDEVSRALPPYTWISSIVQTNIAPVTPPPATAGTKSDTAAVESDSVDTTPKVQFRIIGNTVDIQALTRFMKLMEGSPFIENVQLVKSSLVLIDQKEITEFQLDAAYQVPDASAIRTVPVSLSVR